MTVVRLLWRPIRWILMIPVRMHRNAAEYHEFLAQIWQDQGAPIPPRQVRKVQATPRQRHEAEVFSAALRRRQADSVVSLFDITGVHHRERLRQMRLELDSPADDWQRVGDDMRAVMGDLDRAIRKHKEQQ